MTSENKNINGAGLEYLISIIKEKLAGKQDKLTAGSNITIDENNVISASGGGNNKIYFYNRVLNEDLDISDESTWVTNQKLTDLVNYLIEHKNENTVVVQGGVGDTYTDNGNFAFWTTSLETSDVQSKYHIIINQKWISDYTNTVTIDIPFEDYPIQEGYQINYGEYNNQFVYQDSIWNSIGIQHFVYETGAPYEIGSTLFLPDYTADLEPYICISPVEQAIPLEDTEEFWDWYYEHFTPYAPAQLPKMMTDLSVPPEENGNYIINGNVTDGSVVYTWEKNTQATPPNIPRTYTLKCTVDSDGNPSYSWVHD